MLKKISQKTMTINEFNEVYKDQGGFVTLTDFKANAASLETISEYFDVTKERVRQWFQELFKENYDPRPIRRARIIDCMITFAKNSREEEFKEAFKGSNKEYFVYALSECYRLGIYSKK